MAKRKGVGPAELAVRKQIDAGTICGCVTRKGSICMSKAGAGTDHLGEGACWRHDHFQKITQRKPGSRYQDGIGDSALEHFLLIVDNPEIKKLDDEIGLLRFRLDDINRMIEDIRQRAEDDGRDGRYFPQAHGEKLDPAGAADQKALLSLVKDSSRIAESVAKLVSQKHRIEEGKIVTYRQVQEVLAQVIYVIRKHVPEEERLSAIAQDLSAIDVSKIGR